MGLFSNLRKATDHTSVQEETARAVLATLIYQREQGHAVADGDDVEPARWRIVEQ